MSGEVNFVDIDNGLCFLMRLIVTELLKDSHGLLGVRLLVLNAGSPVKEHITSALLWIRIPRLPSEVWIESVLDKLLRPIGKVYKSDTSSQITSKGLFGWVCIVMDLLKPLKKEIKYRRNGVI